jgi:hypothetical protein
LYALLNHDDIITYTFWDKIMLTKESKKDVQSGISEWRLDHLFNKI